MTLYDVSLPVRPGMPVWPGDPAVELERTGSIAEGDDANVSHLSCGVHTGTHIDAPLHFLEGGASADSLDLNRMIGPAQVVDLAAALLIDRQVLENAAIRDGETRLLFKTSNSARWANPNAEFDKGYVAVDQSGAEWLAERKTELVGIDYLSIATWGQTTGPHRVLLGAGIVVVEGLDLRQVPPGRYELICLPVKLVGSDGAPARVVLRSLPIEVS